MPSETPDVVVVGAGITGCFTAFFLARQGLSTVLLEQAGVGNQTSACNPGGLNPMHGPGIPGVMSPLATHSFALHLQNRATIAELSGLDVELRRVSRLELAFAEGEREALLEALTRYEAADGFSACWLDRQTLLAEESRVSPEAIGGLLTEGNAMVDGHSYTVAISRAAQKLGAKLLAGTVTGLKHHGSRVTAVVMDSETLPCGFVVLATGPWVAGPESWLACSIPVQPVKGQLLLAELAGPAFRHHISWQTHGLYNLFPAQADGKARAWLGGTQEQAGFDTSPTREGRETIMNQMARLVPALRNVTVLNQVTGLRPVTPDGFPIVGKVPGWDNAYLATGAGTKGMLISSGMAESVARLIAQLPPCISIEQYAPDRFDASNGNHHRKSPQPL